MRGDGGGTSSNASPGFTRIDLLKPEALMRISLLIRSLKPPKGAAAAPRILAENWAAGCSRVAAEGFSAEQNQQRARGEVLGLIVVEHA